MNYELSKIRIKCAEIVGWTYIEQLAFTGIPKGSRGNADARVIPAFTESADAALGLVAWLEKQGWDVHVFFEGGNCSIELLSHSQIPIISSEGKTFPLVACLAFLKANNIDPETL